MVEHPVDAFNQQMRSTRDLEETEDLKDDPDAGVFRLFMPAKKRL
jgi:hypothetical protein